MESPSASQAASGPASWPHPHLLARQMCLEGQLWAPGLSHELSRALPHVPVSLSELLPSGIPGGLHQAGQPTLWLVTLFSRRPDTAAGVSAALGGTGPCPPAEPPAALAAASVRVVVGPADTTEEDHTRGEPLSPRRPFLGSMSSFPPISKSCGLRRVAAQPPPCACCLFSRLAKNAGKLGGGDTGNASFPLRTAPAASGGSWGRGAGLRKVVPPPRQTRTPQPCTQKGSFSPILAHCECPLRGESRPRTPEVSLPGSRPSLGEERGFSCSLLERGLLEGRPLAI